MLRFAEMVHSFNKSNCMDLLEADIGNCLMYIDTVKTEGIFGLRDYLDNEDSIFLRQGLILVETLNKKSVNQYFRLLASQRQSNLSDLARCILAWATSLLILKNEEFDVARHYLRRIIDHQGTFYDNSFQISKCPDFSKFTHQYARWLSSQDQSDTSRSLASEIEKGVSKKERVETSIDSTTGEIKCKEINDYLKSIITDEDLEYHWKFSSMNLNKRASLLLIADDELKEKFLELQGSYWNKTHCIRYAFRLSHEKNFSQLSFNIRNAIAEIQKEEALEEEYKKTE